jgi:hypothetical protein
MTSLYILALLLLHFSIPYFWDKEEPVLRHSLLFFNLNLIQAHVIKDADMSSTQETNLISDLFVLRQKPHSL